MTGCANTPTAVVVLVRFRGGILTIRCALPGEGQGQLALPGGDRLLGQPGRRPERPRSGRRPEWPSSRPGSGDHRHDIARPAPGSDLLREPAGRSRGAINP